MAITEYAKKYHKKLFPGYVSSFLQTNPEFIERFDNFTFDEVVNHSQLDEKNRWLSILSTLIGCQEIDEYKALLPASFHFGLTPVEVKEMVYQATAYLGIGRVFPFLKATTKSLRNLELLCRCKDKQLLQQKTDWKRALKHRLLFSAST